MKITTQNTLFQSLLTLSILTLTACQTAPNLAPAGSKTASGTAIVKDKPRPKIDTSKEAQLNIPYRSLEANKDLTTIGFGSCVDQNQPQPIWSVIQKNSPELFLMMGDNVYSSKKEDKPTIDQYIKLNKNADYRKLRETTPFLATWDDNDFGQNDGGATNPDKEEARHIFLKYWSYLKPSLPIGQKAIYHSRLIGSKNHKVQIILLDTRWDRSDLTKNPDYNPQSTVSQTTTSVATSQTGVSQTAVSQIVLLNQPPKIYLPSVNPKDQILSAEQWKWLEDELRKPAQLRLIVSSIQLIPNDHYFEKWGNFPLEKEKFFSLLKKYRIKNAVILSGDRHLSAVAKTEIKGLGPLYEITASSLNKPSKATEPEKDSSYVAESFLKPNFGLLQINWSNKTATFKIIDENNTVIIEQPIKF